MPAQQKTRAYPFPFYLTISFVEGAAVMACELLSARMIAPFYGTTLFVWSTVIGVTLAALATGYFTGGYLADRFSRNSLLFSVLAIGSVFIALMPLMAEWSLEFTSNMGIRTGTFISGLIFLFPPLACLGTTSPIIIRLAAKDVQHTGRTAGTVYAVSTVAGILATFLIGFWVIPSWGITFPAYFTAGVLSIFPLVFFVKQKRFSAPSIMLGTFAIISFFAFRKTQATSPSDWNILYTSEGLMGQVLVADLKWTEEESQGYRRVLFVNRHPQTNINMKTGYSFWPYPHVVAVAASIKPAGSTALVLGLGGGSVVDEFLRLGFRVDACELDERIADVAREFFHLSTECNVVVDDARHYVRTTDNTYDILLIDTFTGEQPPSHLLTLENCLEMKRILSKEGILIINFTGFISGEKGLAARSILRTLHVAGLHTKVVGTPGAEAERNLVIIASQILPDYSIATNLRPNACCKIPIPLPFLGQKDIDIHNALVFTDDKPLLEVVHLGASESWRTGDVSSFSTKSQSLPFF